MEIPLGERCIEIKGITKDEWKSLEGSVHAEIMDRFVVETIPTIIAEMRGALIANDMGKAREFEGYCAAFEDLSDLLREGLSAVLES